jgi:hypothetical protein
MANEDLPRFELFKPEDLKNLPKPSWLIDQILPEGGLVVLYGSPGTKKTFIALSMALSIASGHAWCGRPTKPGNVLYVAAEGISGIAVRVEAYQREHKIDAVTIRYIKEPFDLRRESHARHLISTLEAEGFEPNLIVLDTLARLTPGAEENLSKDMGEAVSAIDILRRRYNATVLLIHHPGKAGGPERGSSALRGAADAMIECTSASQYRSTLNCDKMKDAEEFRSLSIHFQQHEFDDEISSLAVAGAAEIAASGGIKDQGTHRALRVLEEKFGAEGATHREWREQFERETGKKQRTFNRDLNVLRAKGLVRQDGNRYYANTGNNGVKCHSVPRQCHDTSGNGVMSSPSLGDDTDTTASGPVE